MALPVVAVIGRPNVGKSTFVNRIAQVKDAIVHESSGVTRDRSYHKADWNGVQFMLVDTGGIELSSDDEFQSSINAQVDMAAVEADAIIVLVDGRTSVSDADEEVARMLKRIDKPTFLCVNKLDDPSRTEVIWDYLQLGLGTPYAVSALHGNGTGDLLDDVVAALPGEMVDEDEADISIAIIGRPNAGKSSLTNKLLGRERSIVSGVAGTTRDSIDTLVQRDDRVYRLVDTAGIRRKGLIQDDIEYYGFLRALRSIERADVALLVIDAPLGLTDQDQRVAKLADEKGCALVILLNKWDLMDDPDKRDQLIERIGDRLSFVGYAPVLRISAETGRSVDKIWDLVENVYACASNTIPTSRLNSLLTDIRDFGHTVTRGSKRLKLNYVTQTGTNPPVFTFFANFPEIVDDSFRRYLENRLRDTFDLTGTPIRLKFRKKG